MTDLKLGIVERRFAELIWANEPLSSGALVKLCEAELHWKKPTTYTVLRKLCEKGIFRNENGAVTSLLTRADFDAIQGAQLVNESYGGSLPAFIAAFAAGRPLSEKEIAKIREMIDRFGKENGV